MLEAPEVTVPLQNFRMEGDGLALGLRLRIAPFTPLDKHRLLPHWRDSPFVDGWSDYPSLAAATFRLYGRAGRGSEVAEPLADIGTAITALRLFKAGDVGMAVAFQHGRERKQGRQPELMMINYTDWAARRPGYMYELSAGEWSGLRAKMRLVRRAFDRARDHELDFGLRRFHQSFSRTREEDRIIDYAIVLESTLLKDVKDELTYRLGLRAAALLAGRREPQETQGWLAALYAVRSKVVHDGKQLRGDQDVERMLRRLDDSLSPEEFPRRWEQIVRDVLNGYIAAVALGGSIKDTNEALESRITASLKSATRRRRH